MRLPASIVLAAAALALAASADAQVYKWKDANGVTHYSDAPPQSGSYERVKINTNVTQTVKSEPPPAATSTDSPGDTSNQSGAPTKPTPDTADNRTQLCKQLDANVALLSGDSPVADPGATKPGQNLSDVQRKQALENAKAQQKTFCSSNKT